MTELSVSNRSTEQAATPHLQKSSGKRHDKQLSRISAIFGSRSSKISYAKLEQNQTSTCSIFHRLMNRGGNSHKEAIQTQHVKAGLATLKKTDFAPFQKMCDHFLQIKDSKASTPLQITNPKWPGSILLTENNSYLLIPFKETKAGKSLFNAINFNTGECTVVTKQDFQKNGSPGADQSRVAIAPLAVDLVEDLQTLAAAQDAEKGGLLPIIEMANVYFTGSKEIKTQFVVFKRCEGGNLFDRIQSGAPLTAVERKNIALDIANGVHQLHKNGIEHRDLTSTNVLLHNGRAFVADFEYTSRSGADPVIGTFAYSAPEQLTGTLDKQSERWSLGCILHQVFSGKLPQVTNALDEKVKPCFIKLQQSEQSDEEIDEFTTFLDTTLKSQLPWEMDDKWNGVSKGENLVKSLMRIDPAARLELDDLILMLKDIPATELLFGDLKAK